MIDRLFERWREKLFLLLVLGAVCGTGILLVNWLVSEKSLPLTELIIEGEKQFVTDKELQTTLRDIPKGGNFFTLDVNLVQQQVEQLPWVRQASVRKQWPNRLVLFLHEQQAVAWWNGKQFINKQGELFSAPDLLKMPLVKLTGPKQSETKVLEAFLKLEQLVDLNGFELAEVNLNERHDWSVTFTNGLQLYIGQHNMLDRVQRFIELYPKIETKNKIAYLDLRYDTGIAVGWQ